MEALGRVAEQAEGHSGEDSGTRQNRGRRIVSDLFPCLLPANRFPALRSIPRALKHPSPGSQTVGGENGRSYGLKQCLRQKNNVRADKTMFKSSKQCLVQKEQVIF